MTHTKEPKKVFIVHECSYDTEAIDSVWTSRGKANLRLKVLKEEQSWTHWIVETFDLNKAPTY